MRAYEESGITNPLILNFSPLINSPRHPWDRRMGGRKRRSVEERSPLPVQKFERRFLGRQARSLVTVSTVSTTPVCLHTYRAILSLEAPNKFGKSIPEFGETHLSVLGCERRLVSASIMSWSCFASFPVCVYKFSSHYLSNVIFYRQ